jgi:hypothetical protein
LPENETLPIGINREDIEEVVEIGEGIIRNSYDDTDEIIKPQAIAPLIKTSKLKNGITIHTIENHLTPTISVVGIIETGYIPENLEGQHRELLLF